MKFAIIGHCCKDEIHQADGTVSTGFGGIYYAVASMAAIASSEDTIIPIFGAGPGDLDELKQRLSRFSNIDLRGIFPLEGETNTVKLFYQQDGSRVECSNSISPPIPFSRIDPFLAVHGILINMVSGFDLAIETLDEIRMAVRSKNTPIHFDLHSLTLAVEEGGQRERRPMLDWRRWCFMIRSVQLNEEEAQGISVEKYDELALVKQMHPLMVDSICLTRGERGVTIFLRDHKHIIQHDLAIDPSVVSIDTTGCGDVFGAAYLYQYCRMKNDVDAAIFANRVAAAKATLHGSEELEKLISFRPVEEP